MASEQKGIHGTWAIVGHLLWRLLVPQLVWEIFGNFLTWRAGGGTFVLVYLGCILLIGVP